MWEPHLQSDGYISRFYLFPMKKSQTEISNRCRERCRLHQHVARSLFSVQTRGTAALPDPPPPICWAMMFRGHSALLPTHRLEDEEDRRCGFLVVREPGNRGMCETEYSFRSALENDSPPPPSSHPCWSCCTEADENVVWRLALVPESTRNRSYSPYSWCCLRLIPGKHSISAASGLFSL